MKSLLFGTRSKIHFIIQDTTMTKINPNEVYTTEQARNFLKVSESTIKRFLKNGIIRANKVGGRYRILGKELLRLVSPVVEKQAVDIYGRIKEKTRKTIEKW